MVVGFCREERPWAGGLCSSLVVHLEKRSTGAHSKLVVACSYLFHANPLRAFGLKMLHILRMSKMHGAIQQTVFP